MTSEENAPFPLGQLVGPINGTGNGAVYDYHQAPNGAWIVGIGGGSSALRYFLASDLERKNAWGLRWEGE